MSHKTHLTLIAALIILILMKTKLQAFRVANAIFRVADEMRRLPAYFDNPGCKHRNVVGFNSYSFVFL